MGRCPGCQTELLSTGEVAGRLTVVSGRVRNILGAHPGRLQGARVGWAWLVPQPGVEGYVSQPPGVHVDGNGVAPVAGACPVCGEALLSPQQAAREIGVHSSRVYAVLKESPDQLLAFHVGERWVVPQRGVQHYIAEKKRRAAQRKQERLRGAVQELLAARQEQDALPDAVKVEVRFRQATCNCGAVQDKKTGKKFPHRPGGGRCKADPMQGAAIVDVRLVE